MSTQGNINTPTNRYWPPYFVVTGAIVTVLLLISRLKFSISPSADKATELLNFFIAGLVVFFASILASEKNKSATRYKNWIAFLLFIIVFTTLNYIYDLKTEHTGRWQWQPLFLRLAAFLFSVIAGAAWHLLRVDSGKDHQIPAEAFADQIVLSDAPPAPGHVVIEKTKPTPPVLNGTPTGIRTGNGNTRRKQEYRKVNQANQGTKAQQISTAGIQQEAEKMLEKEFEKIKRERTRQFEAGLQKELAELREQQKISLENDLNREREEIRALQLEILETQLADEQDAIREQQRAMFEARLAKEQQALAEEKLKQFEAGLQAEQQTIRNRYEQRFEKELKEQQDLIRKQQEVLINEEAKKQEAEIALQKEKFAATLDLEQQNLLKGQQEAFEAELLKYRELKNTEKLELERQLAKEKDEIRSRHQQKFETELIAEQQHIIDRQEAIKQELINRQEVESKLQREAFENSLLNEQSEIRKRRQLSFEEELLKEEESMRQTRLTAFENKIRLDQEELAKKHALVFEKQLLQEQDEIKKHQLTAFENSLKQEQEALRVARLSSFEHGLLQEQQHLKKKQLEEFETELKTEHEKIKAEQKALLDLELNEYRLAAANERAAIEKTTVVEIAPKIIETGTEITKTLPRYKPSNRKAEDKTLDLVISNQRPVIILNGVTIYLQLAAAVGTVEESVFIYAAPLEMLLGDYFNHFVNARLRERKNEIEIADSEQMLFQWNFYKKGILSTKKLDPALSLAKNKIQETSVIIARRVTP